MAISPTRYIREINAACAVLTFSAAIACAVYSNGRGIVQLTYTVNNTHVQTTPHMFDIAFVFSGMLTYSTMFHLATCYSAVAVFKNICSNQHANRVLGHLLVVIPAITVATVVGIGAVTDVFAVYASMALGLLLPTVLWVSSQTVIHGAWRIVFLTAVCVFYTTYWVFVWANTVHNTTPIVMLSLSVVFFLSVCATSYSISKRPLVRVSIVTNAIVGLQLSCAGMWVALHHDANITTGAGVMLIGVLFVYGALLLFTCMRLTGAVSFIASAADNDDITQELLRVPSIDETSTDEDGSNDDDDDDITLAVAAAGEEDKLVSL